jgi:hypothetical protein
LTIKATCTCGRTYPLKDSYAGQSIQCPACGDEFLVPGIEHAFSTPVFERDRYLLRQKHLALTAEKYRVFAEDGEAILHVRRPYHILRTILALLVGVLVAICILAGSIFATVVIEDNRLAIAVVIFAAPVMVLAGVGAAVACSKKRHVSFFEDEDYSRKVLDVVQHEKLHFFTGSYTVRDASEQPLAVLRKHYIYNIIRKRWYCFRPDGSLWFLLQEDSALRSVLRRFLGPMFGVLRQNFVFTRPEDEEVLGEFNRDFTILDRYVLDMSADRDGSIDRRVAVAAGVLLDTGERR